MQPECDPRRPAVVDIASDRLYVRTLEHTAMRLQDLGKLKPGLTVTKATDVMWFYFGHRSWGLLVAQHRQRDEAERWLVEQASNALLES
jgi:hypothetical protein